MSPLKSLSGNVFRKKDDIVCREIAGETFLVPVRGKLADMQKIFSLNPVAEYIWGQLDGERTMGYIRSGIMKSFEVEEEQAEEDLHEFINELLQADLIVEVK